ncbi:hypothetical protein HYH03_016122 [Edaphochlamys debaryana]|uniref:Protein kinase domain-containing protein n=1 Tax=Edaphochlamys debaryana TaxID=47281 RepID=A0A835XQG9_9CHLO|nr:hypothetical protein HYH03_016122 [Edaphochlamys debaryana]|eukprot:KAG2485135.1 hypothetical protein HYH03_016122 [Edaphochlamys debaryana]
MAKPVRAKDEVNAVTIADLKRDLVVRKQIGKGGFAAVFSGTYKGTEVAVKVILAEHASSPDSVQVKLFLREGQYMSRVSHKHIVKCYAVCQLPPDFPGIEGLGHRGPTWALVLELVPGGSMGQLLMRQMSQTRRAYSEYEAFCWVRDVAEALNYLHTAPRPVMHRDIKADNVLLTSDPESGRPCAKLMDFGALDGRNPLLRRRSLAHPSAGGMGGAGDSGLGRTSTRSAAGGSQGGGGGGGSLAAPSVATYYADTTHEAGKIFYLVDELPTTTVTAIPEPAAQRRGSIDIVGAAATSQHAAAAAAIAAAVTPTGGGGAPPLKTQFGFGGIASRGASFDGGAAAAGLAAAAAAAATSGPLAVKTSLTRGVVGLGGPGGMVGAGGTGTGMAAGGLVPLSEEASYHGNTAGYASMLMHQQMQRQQARAAAAASAAAAAAAAAALGHSATPHAHSSAHPHHLPHHLHHIAPVTHSLPSSLHGSLHGATPGGAGAGGPAGGGGGGGPGSFGGTGGHSPLDSPASSSRWQASDVLTAGAVRLRMQADSEADPTSPTAAATAATSAAAPTAAAVNGHGGTASRTVSGRDGSLARLSAAVAKPAAGMAEEPDPCFDPGYEDVLLRETTPIKTTALQLKLAGENGNGQPPTEHQPHHSPGNGHGNGNGASLAAAALASLQASQPPSRRVSHDAVPIIDVHGSAARPLTPPQTAAVPIPSGGGGGGGAAAVIAVAHAAAAGGPDNKRAASSSSLGVRDMTKAEREDADERASATSRTSSRSGLGPGSLGLAGTSPGGSRLHPAVAALVAEHRSSSQRSMGTGSNPGALTPGAGGGGGGPLGTVSITRLLQGRYEQDFQWVWRLTGQTGSCMYMAPEVFRNMPYNEKVDVFSFGVLVYEVFSRNMLVVSALNLKELRLMGKDTPEGYASHVASGYRPPRPNAMPLPLYELISACWAADPCNRPAMADVVETLRVLQEALAPHPPAASVGAACGCSVM